MFRNMMFPGFEKEKKTRIRLTRGQSYVLEREKYRNVKGVVMEYFVGFGIEPMENALFAKRFTFDAAYKAVRQLPKERKWRYIPVDDEADGRWGIIVVKEKNADT